MWRVTTGSVHRPGNFWFSSWGWNDWDVCLLRRGQARWIHPWGQWKISNISTEWRQWSQIVFFLCFWNRPWTWWECGPCGSTSIFWGSQCCDFASQELQVGHNPICYYKTLVFGLLKTPSSWGAGPSIGPTKILRNTPSTLLCQVKNATAVAKCAQQRSSFPQGGNARTIACNPGGPTDDGSSFVVMSFCYI